MERIFSLFVEVMKKINFKKSYKENTEYTDYENIRPI